MRVVFFGTPDVAVPSLTAARASSHAVVGVVTQPDRPRGRGRAVTRSPVKEVALARGIPLLQPASPKDPPFAAALAALSPDVLAVVAYGHILPPNVLAVARAINVHFSLLPRYRGAAPVQRALMDGASETGVSVFLLEPTVDTGPVLLRERVSVAETETAGDLLERLAPIGARLLVSALDGLGDDSLTAQPQAAAEASAAPKIRPEEAAIDWTRPAAAVVNLVRALNPRPAAWTSFRGRRLVVWRARATEGSGPPGSVLDAGGLVVATGVAAVSLDEVQPEGKRAMSGDAFVRGYRPFPGERLGES